MGPGSIRLRGDRGPQRYPSPGSARNARCCGVRRPCCLYDAKHPSSTVVLQPAISGRSSRSTTRCSVSCRCREWNHSAGCDVRAGTRPSGWRRTGGGRILRDEWWLVPMGELMIRVRSLSGFAYSKSLPPDRDHDLALGSLFGFNGPSNSRRQSCFTSASCSSKGSRDARLGHGLLCDYRPGCSYPSRALPIAMKVGGHRPTKIARRSAVPRLPPRRKNHIERLSRMDTAPAV